MKKLICLSATVLMAAMAFAQQDTIPPVKKNFPDSLKMDTRDSMSTSNNWNSDTSSLGRSKWKDSDMHKKHDSSMTGAKNRADTSLGGATNTMTQSANTMNQSATTTLDSAKKYSDKGNVNRAKDNMAATATDQATGSTQDSSTNGTTMKKTDEDRVVMTENNVVVVRNGDSTALADSIKLNSGAVVQKDGTVRFRNGSTTKLKKGQFINLNPADNKKTKKTVKKSNA